MAHSSSLSRAQHRATAVIPQLPKPELSNANRADAFEIETRNSAMDIRTLAEQRIGSMPKWARCLLSLRNFVVAPFGLKPDGICDARGAAGRVDIFAVLEQTENRIVLGLDDRHLDFRIIVQRDGPADKCVLRATTLVRWHNVFGRVHLISIMPFHRLIQRSVQKNAV